MLLAAKLGATIKIVAIQAAWRGSRLRRAWAHLGFAGQNLMPTVSGKVAFSESFILPAKRVLHTAAAEDAASEQLGARWVSTRQRLEKLGLQEALDFPEGYTLAEELQEAVYLALHWMWQSLERSPARWMASWHIIRESYESRVSRLRSTANQHRRWLMRVYGCTEAEANEWAAKAYAVVIRESRQQA